MKWFSWPLALLISLSVHAGLMLTFGAPKPQKTGYAMDEGDGGIEVGLGHAGSYEEQATEEAIEEVTEPAPKPVEPTPY